MTEIECYTDTITIPHTIKHNIYLLRQFSYSPVEDSKAVTVQHHEEEVSSICKIKHQNAIAIQLVPIDSLLNDTITLIK